MLFDKTLSSRPLSSPRHSDEAAPPPSENLSDAPPAQPRRRRREEVARQPRVNCGKTPPAPTVSPIALESQARPPMGGPRRE